jgi:hypothetical protein
MALFRYFSPEAALRVLETGELMVTPPKYLNDPFECSPVIKCKDPRAFARRQIDRLISLEFFEEHRSHFPGLTFEEYRNRLLSKAAGLEELEERILTDVPGADSHIQGRAQDIISERFGVICFTGDGFNQAMWAHYASSHEGLVIEVQQNHLLFSGPSFFHIHYSDEPVVFDASDPTARDDAALFLSRKRLDWSSERESRLLVELALATVHHLPEGLRYFIPIGPEVIASVTLGLRATNETKDRVLELLRAPHFEHVKAFKIRKNVEGGLFERDPW